MSVTCQPGSRDDHHVADLLSLSYGTLYLIAIWDLLSTAIGPLAIQVLQEFPLYPDDALKYVIVFPLLIIVVFQFNRTYSNLHKMKVLEVVDSPRPERRTFNLIRGMLRIFILVALAIFIIGESKELGTHTPQELLLSFVNQVHKAFGLLSHADSFPSWQLSSHEVAVDLASSLVAMMLILLLWEVLAASFNFETLPTFGKSSKRFFIVLERVVGVLFAFLFLCLLYAPFFATALITFILGGVFVSIVLVNAKADGGIAALPGKLISILLSPLLVLFDVLMHLLQIRGCHDKCRGE